MNFENFLGFFTSPDENNDFVDDNYFNVLCSVSIFNIFACHENVNVIEN